MKKMFTLLMAVLLPLLVCAQNATIDKVFSKYADREGFAVISINKGLLKLAANLDDSDAEAQAFLQRVHQIKILASDNASSGVNLFDEVLSDINKRSYEELLTVKKDGEEVLILANKDGDLLKEIIILVAGKETAMVYISGELRMKDLSKLSSSVKGEGTGMQYLNEIK